MSSIQMGIINGEHRAGYGTNTSTEPPLPGSSDLVENSGTTRNIKDDVEHCHVVSAESGSKARETARKKILYVIVCCIVFMTVEVIGGLLAGSLAVLSDAAHLLSDLLGFIISYTALILSDKRPSKRLNWGWHRAEVLGAMLSVLLIWVITAVLVVFAILRIIRSTYRIDAEIMMITAGFAIIMNAIMLCVLHDPFSGHGHSHYGHSHHGHSSHGHLDSPGHSNHGHSHGELSRDECDHQQLLDKKKIEKPDHDDHTKNVNVRAAMIHIIGDLCQSLAVFIAAVVIYIKPEYKLADPICTFIFSIIVIGTTRYITMDIIKVLMEGMPDGIDFIEVLKSLKQIQGVRSVHDLRIWMITTGLTVCSVHLTIDKINGIDQMSIVKCTRSLMRQRYNITDCTIQVEEYASIMDECEQCVVPDK